MLPNLDCIDCIWFKRQVLNLITASEIRVNLAERAQLAKFYLFEFFRAILIQAAASEQKTVEVHGRTFNVIRTGPKIAHGISLWKEEQARKGNLG